MSSHSTYQGCGGIERIPNARYVPGGELDGDARHELEGAHAIAARIAHAGEQRHGGARVGNCDERRGEGAQLGEELQAGGGDDAEGAFGAEKRDLMS